MTSRADNIRGERVRIAEEFNLRIEGQETTIQERTSGVFQATVPSDMELSSPVKIENILQVVNKKTSDKSDDQIVDEVIFNSQAERLKKITDLTGPQQKTLKKVEIELDALRQPAEHLAAIISEEAQLFEESLLEKSDSSMSIDISFDAETLTSEDVSAAQTSRDEKRQQLSKEYQETLQILNQKVNEIIALANTGEQVLNKDHFSGWYSLQNVESMNPELAQYHLPMIKEQVLNRMYNCIRYLAAVRNFIEKKKIDILKEFYKTDEPVNLESVQFTLKLGSFETHNQGKVASEVTFFQNDRILFKVFFKPRSAKIDATIIALFDALNKLTEKSLNILLPVFKIIAYETDDCSLWEFIDGRHPEHTTNIEIEKMDIPEDKKQKMRNSLLRLESICKKLNVSDLHKENVLVVSDNRYNSPIVPIDLESIQPGSDTGLYESHSPLYPELSFQEKACLSSFSLSDSEFRVVPIATGTFDGALSNPIQFAEISSLLLQACDSLSYEIQLPLADIKVLILTDFLRHDVPYFTEEKSQLYLGNSGQRVHLGRKKEIV